MSAASSLFFLMTNLSLGWVTMMMINVDDDDDDHLLLVRLPKLEYGLADLLSYLSLCAKVRRQAGLQLRRLLTVQQVWHQLGNLRSKVEDKKMLK